MSDPFADVDAASPDIIKIIVAGLETTAADPTMLPVIDAYLDRLDPPEGGLIVDIGCGTGGVTRRIADRFGQASVLGIERSNALTGKARVLVSEGVFGQPLADALEAEYLRRAAATDIQPEKDMPISAIEDATGLLYLILPAGWGGAQHPSPRRQVAFCLSGRLRVEAGDGEVREFGAGAIWRMEDVAGAGHTTTVLGDDDVRLAIAQLLPQPGDPTGKEAK